MTRRERRRVLVALRRGPLAPAAAALILQMPERTLRRHASELRSAGLVRGYERLELTPTGRERVEGGEAS
jgi:hypothetical protein